MEIELPEEYADWVPAPDGASPSMGRLAGRDTYLRVGWWLHRPGYPDQACEVGGVWLVPPPSPKVPKGLRPGAVVEYRTDSGFRHRVMLGRDGYWFDADSRYSPEVLERSCAGDAVTVLLEGSDD